MSESGEQRWVLNSGAREKAKQEQYDRRGWTWCSEVEWHGIAAKLSYMFRLCCLCQELWIVWECFIPIEVLFFLILVLCSYFPEPEIQSVIDIVVNPPATNIWLLELINPQKSFC